MNCLILTLKSSLPHLIGVTHFFVFEVMIDYNSCKINKNLGMGLNSFWHWTLGSISLVIRTAWHNENCGHFRGLYLDDWLQEKWK